jgi:hypothetical protein
VGAGGERGPLAWAALVGALGSAGTNDLRCATAPAEAGGTPDARVEPHEQGARGPGGVCDGQEQGARSEQRGLGAHGEMAEAANTEWGGRMAAALCCEVHDGRTSGEIFLLRERDGGEVERKRASVQSDVRKSMLVKLIHA